MRFRRRRTTVAPDKDECPTLVLPESGFVTIAPGRIRRPGLNVATPEAARRVYGHDPRTGPFGPIAARAGIELVDEDGSR